MDNRLYRFIALFFLLFPGFSASARGGLYHINHTDDKKSSVSAATAHHLPYNPYSYEFILNGAPSQLLNLQQHRGSHSMQGIYNSPNFYSIHFKYLSFICGGGTGELSRFRKLILFPFHDFW
ncbi:hypothetical protein [Mucilaginibacter dorajii]|uniref:Uncharacterized protein n=1 Tax=Mucilaginibacter dorajii TaxID=692994 RepID=A0ABP7P0S7_9SPHI|nr:hypothetical protein [Mucilaginibacter dorajii]MCS3735562.1 hypothetical protein [Mucilaginibacter dorajii]